MKKSRERKPRQLLQLKPRDREFSKRKNKLRPVPGSSRPRKRRRSALPIWRLPKRQQQPRLRG